MGLSNLQEVTCLVNGKPEDKSQNVSLIPKNLIFLLLHFYLLDLG